MVNYYMKLIWPALYENMEVKRPEIPVNWKLFLDGSNNPGWDVRNVLDSDFRTEILIYDNLEEELLYDPLIHMTYEELQNWIKIVRSKVYGISKSIDPLETIRTKEEMLSNAKLDIILKADFSDINTIVANQMSKVTNLADAKVLLEKILTLNLYFIKMFVGKTNNDIQLQ